MKKNFNTIIVATDFSEKASAALEESFNLARLTNLDITLFHVIRDAGSSFSTLFDSVRPSRKDKEYENQVKEEILKLAEHAESKSGIRVNSIISKGKVYDKILKASELLESKFIIIGQNGEQFKRKKDYLGSNAERVIKKAKSPVITINQRHNYDGCRSILLPLDLTVETRQKVTNAIEIAKLFGSAIKTISVVSSMKDKAVVSRLEQQLMQVKNFIGKEKIECKAELVEMTARDKCPACAILNYADEQGDIDLIMVMTQQESGLFEYFIGSSAQEIIRRSRIPVMSIIPKQLGFISFVP